MAPLTTWLLTALVGLANGLASTDTITWGGDNSRAGYQSTHNMDPSVVGSSQFGQLFRTQLPGNYGGSPEQIFSQPLVYTPSGGDGTQYVYVATQQNNVYKLNAKTGAIIASRNLHIPFLTADLDGCVDVNPHVGITATGVIDPTTDTLYLTSKTYFDQTKTGVAQGRPNGRYYIHALDVNTLAERPNFPVNLEGTVARNNPIRSFNGGIHHQRPALLHVGQYVYAGFASHCVQYNFTGWIIGWDKTTGNIVERWATQGQGVPATTPGAGVWMSGGGLASDDAGSMFFATGNGYASQLSTIPVSGRSPPTAMEEAAVHMSIGGDGSLTVTDFFMPWEKQALDGADKDLGTSPLQILPSAFACGDVKRIGVVTGKSGKTYWINLDNMGGYRNGANSLDAVIQVYQNDNSVYAGAGVYPLEGGYMFINVIGYPTNVFKFSCTAGVPAFTKVATSPAANAGILGVSHGSVTSLNGQAGTGLIWTLDVQGSQLRIYDAVPKNGAMNLIKSFSVPGSTKFGRAVFGDGIMYQGTTLGYLYAFGSPVNVPVNCTSSNDFGTVNVGNQSVAKTITCTALIGVTVTDVGLDEADDFVVTNAGTLPRTLTAGQTFSLSVAFKPTTVGLVSSDLLVNTTNAVAGYSQNTHVRLTGTGESSSPLLAVTPPTVTFQGIIAGSNGTLEETVIISNQGNTPLSITNVQFSTTSAQGPFTTWNHETAALTVGKFTLTNIPATIAPNSAVTVSIAFDSSVAGSFGAYLTVNSNGGSKSFTIAGSAGAAPAALIEFQTPDGTGWVQYDANKNFTFGNVTENTSRNLKFRVTNNATTGGVKLILTVSKPPFGIPGIVSAANTVDLAEGTQLAPGESATATMVCSVPKSAWNVDAYVGSAPWTMNTNDPNFEKHFFTFVCNAVAEQAPPLLPSGQGKYRYLGCYKENNPGRQLAQQIYGQNAVATTATCIAACAANNYVFCGTQYRDECWGGPKIPTLRVDDSNCNYDCAGDLNQICGGNGVGDYAGGSFISLFADSLQFDGNTTTPTDPTDPTDPTNPTNPSNPVVNPGVGQYSSLGCYSEGTNSRALPNLVNLATPTIANCITACAANKYTYIGMEYGGECWCGNTLADGALPALAADCSMPCNGNSSEYCGGPNRLNMYQFNSSLPAPSGASTTSASTGTSTGTATATSAAATTTAANSRIGDWLFQGCWTEGNGVRALPARMYANDTMTLQTCGGFCGGLKYFGVEYGRECWCGDALDATSTQAPLTDCSFPCPGDSTQKCGAGNRLQLYMYSPVVSSSATATTSSSAATSTSPSSSAASVTVQDKVAANSTSATLSASGSTVTSTSSNATSLSTSTSSTPGLIPAAVTSTTSSSSSSALTTSSSNSSTAQSTTISAPSSSSTSTSASLSTSSSTVVSSSTSTSSFTAAAVSTTSSSSSRASSSSTASSSATSSSSSLSTSTASSSSSSSSSTVSSSSSSSVFSAAAFSSTASSSSSSSSSKASSISSTSSSSSPGSSSSSASSTLTSSSSSSSPSSTATFTPFTSSSTSTIKSSSSSSSSSTSSAKPTATGPITVQGDQNFTYYGCWSEPQVGRLLPAQIVNDGTNMTINKCLSACSDKLYAGVEYGRECWCGNTLNLGGSGGTAQAANVSSTQCNKLCPGDNTQYCGAGVRLNLYILRTEYARLQNLAGTSS